MGRCRLTPRSSIRTARTAFRREPFNTVQENFLPPKTWKRTVPSSGQWSFKLSFGSRTDGVDGNTTSSDGGDRERHGGESEIDGNNGSDTREGRQDTEDNHRNIERPTVVEEAGRERNEEVTPRDPRDRPQGINAGNDSISQQQQDEQNPTVSDSSLANVTPEAPKPAGPVPATILERVSIWPGRALCREVAENFLGWEFDGADFCVKEGGMGDAGSEGLEEMEEEAAVRAALKRRERKLRAALSGVKTNQ